MTTPVPERENHKPGPLTPAVEKNARMSANRRRRRPLPELRRDADDLYRPSPRIASQPASAPRLVRLQNLGLLPHITNQQAHELILDAMYDEDGKLRLDPTIHERTQSECPEGES